MIRRSDVEYGYCATYKYLTAVTDKKKSKPSRTDCFKKYDRPCHVSKQFVNRCNQTDFRLARPCHRFQF